MKRIIAVDFPQVYLRNYRTLHIPSYVQRVNGRHVWTMNVPDRSRHRQSYVHRSPMIYAVDSYIIGVIGGIGVLQHMVHVHPQKRTEGVNAELQDYERVSSISR